MMRPECPQRRGPRARDGGLVVLEWLLIVAAVAGLAALAVVVAQSVVDDTAEQIDATSARRTAAEIATREVETRARAATAASARTATWAHWDSYFTARCARLAILYNDAAINIDAAFAAPTAAAGADPITQTALAAATEANPTNSAPQIRCNIDEPDKPPTGNPAPPPSIDDYRLAARAIADAAAALRPGDTWATWKAHFEPLCSNLATTYGHLDIGTQSAFNHPKDQNPTDPVTQNHLNAATTATATNGRPQIKCQVT